jgi:CubicO group peptidase (beta-lactamase class C family)
MAFRPLALGHVAALALLASVPSLACGQAPPDYNPAPTAVTGPPAHPLNPSRVRAAVHRFFPPFIRAHRVTGLSVAVVTAKGAAAKQPRTQIFNFGVTSRASKARVTSSTLWQMGSESKLFTAVLLAELAGSPASGVSITEPLQTIVPPGVSVPSRDGIQILLRDLGTHRSALPDTPTNVDASSAMERASYTQAKLWAFLGGYSLPWDPGNGLGSMWLYSNLAFGLLGTVLADHEGTDYNTLLTGRLTGPLGMTRTRVQTETDGPIPGMAQGYMKTNRPAPFYNFIQPLVGGGGLISSIADMAKFVAASLGFNPSALTPALLLTQQQMAPGPSKNPRMNMGLAWQLTTSPKMRALFLYKNGATSGFRSATVLVPTEHIGITILSNGPLDPTPPMMAVARALLR